VVVGGGGPHSNLSTCYGCPEALHSGWPTGHTEEEPQRYGEKASRPKEVEQSLTLRHILDLPDFVAPGLPVFFLLSKGSLFRDKFLESL